MHLVQWLLQLLQRGSVCSFFLLSQLLLFSLELLILLLCNPVHLSISLLSQLKQLGHDSTLLAERKGANELTLIRVEVESIEVIRVHRHRTITSVTAAGAVMDESQLNFRSRGRKARWRCIHRELR